MAEATHHPHWPTPFSIVGDAQNASGPFVFTCEHASNAMGPISASEADQRLLETHWGWDIGAADLVRALVAKTDGVGILAGYSRLIIDTNRRPDSKTLLLDKCGHQSISFNQGLTPADVDERLEHVYEPYHRAIDKVLKERLSRGPVRLLSIHSFTPHWAGQPRPMHIGVLFDRYSREASAVRDALEAQGFVAALNAPYSGIAGELMFGASRHGRLYSLPYLELELRQDQLADRAQTEAVAERLVTALAPFHPALP